jgi:probable HAF family extracellular repeat protein
MPTFRHVVLAVAISFPLACVMPTEHKGGSSSSSVEQAVVIPGIGALPPYSVIVLGDPGTGPLMRARAINDSYQIAGQLDDHAFIWRNGVFTLLPNLGTGDYSDAKAINAEGVVGGDSRFGPMGADHVVPDAHATVWQADGVHDLGTLGGHFSAVVGINDQGMAIGYAHSQTRITATAFVYNAISPLTNPEDHSGLCVAQAINARGYSVGFCRRDVGVDLGDSVVWGPGAFSRPVVLPRLPGGDSAGASDINDDGTVVGGSSVGGGASHAFIYDETSGMVDLGTLGGMSSTANAVNDKGQVVGNSQARPGIPNALRGATLWRKNGKAVNLNNEVPAGNPWILSDAIDINHSGAILALGYIGLPPTFDSGLASLLLVPTVLYSVSVNPVNAPLGGGGFTGTVYLSKPAPIDLVVSLRQVRLDFSTPQLPFDLPTSVTVAAGSDFATFAIPTKCLAGPTRAGVEAAMGGGTEMATVNVRVKDGCRVNAVPSGGPTNLP